MKRIVLLVLCVVANQAAWSESTIAAVFERDWKTPGDGLLTFDDVNRREWLDLSVSLLDQFTGAKLEDRYQDAILETAPGGMFEGFSVGKRLDVIALAQSAGIDIRTDDFATNYSNAAFIIELLGPTAHFPSGDVFAVGFIDEVTQFSATLSLRMGAIFEVDVDSGPSGMAGLSVTAESDLLESAAMGVMLYRQVPEPPAVFNLLMAVLLLISIAGRRYSTIVS